MIYFDHNATSPICPAAREAWLKACENYPANPASPHRLGGRAEAALENARVQAAELLGCSPLDLVWTSGATESNNALFHHAGLAGAGEAWVSAVEHPSVLRPARRWFGERLRTIPVNREGVADLDWIETGLRKARPSLVAVMAANNETGVLQPWRDVLRLCREREVPFACDAAQWVGKQPSRGLGDCDFVSGCAHKFGGPVGVGFMKVPARFRPLLVGGEQERGLRSGTQNVASVLAMVAAWQKRNEQTAGGEAVEREGFRDQFVRLLAARLAEFEVLGGGQARLWNTATVLLPGSCRNRWVVKLDKAGFAVSTGSACASGKAEPSHVLTAMGYPSEAAERMIRFSAGWETAREDWEALAAAVLALAEGGAV